jgi:hypothetical protein
MGKKAFSDLFIYSPNIPWNNSILMSLQMFRNPTFMETQLALKKEHLFSWDGPLYFFK